MADALITLHNKTKDRFGDLDNTPYENWLDYYQPFAQDALKNAGVGAQRGTDEEVTEIMTEAYKFWISFLKR